MKSKTSLIDIEKIFDIENEPMPKGAWWWWFWLFFFDNPKNPEKPRQLMILWSTKNSREIDCNNLKLILEPSADRSNLCGAVAAWYFDGEKMHHNFLLEKCNISVSNKELSSNSATPTHFSIDKNKSVIKIGDDFEFIAEPENKHDFTKLSYQKNILMANKGYLMMKLNHLKLSGRVGNEPIHGSAYFQRVFVNSPMSSWYWGLIHFDNGGVLTYFKPYVLGKSLKKEISFFDGKKMHTFKKMKLKKSGKDMPIFEVSGENDVEKIKFTVNAYSHSSWTFKKKFFGILPNKLVYNEYPATVSDFELVHKKTGESIALEDLGKSVSNAEHGTGLMT